MKVVGLVFLVVTALIFQQCYALLPITFKCNYYANTLFGTKYQNEKFYSVTNFLVVNDNTLFATEQNSVFRLKNGFVERIAGIRDISGFQDGTKEDALFSTISGILALNNNTILVSDKENGKIRQITVQDSRVTTLQWNVTSPTKMAWNESLPLVYVLDDTFLLQIDLETNLITVIASSIQEFTVCDNFIYTINTTNSDIINKMDGSGIMDSVYIGSNVNQLLCFNSTLIVRQALSQLWKVNINGDESSVNALGSVPVNSVVSASHSMGIFYYSQNRFISYSSGQERKNTPAKVSTSGDLGSISTFDVKNNLVVSLHQNVIQARSVITPFVENILESVETITAISLYTSELLFYTTLTDVYMLNITSKQNTRFILQNVPVGVSFSCLTVENPDTMFVCDRTMLYQLINGTILFPISGIQNPEVIAYDSDSQVVWIGVNTPTVSLYHFSLSNHSIVDGIVLNRISNIKSIRVVEDSLWITDSIANQIYQIEKSSTTILSLIGNRSKGVYSFNTTLQNTPFETVNSIAFADQRNLLILDTQRSNIDKFEYKCYIPNIIIIDSIVSSSYITIFFSVDSAMNVTSVRVIDQTGKVRFVTIAKNSTFQNVYSVQLKKLTSNTDYTFKLDANNITLSQIQLQFTTISRNCSILT